MASNVIALPRPASNDNFGNIPPSGPNMIRQRLREMLAEYGSDGDYLEDPRWSKADWQALVDGCEGAKELAADLRERAELSGLATSMMVAMSHEVMTKFARNADGPECIESLLNLQSYIEHLEQVAELGRIAFARLFGITLHMHGGGTGPTVREVA